MALDELFPRELIEMPDIPRADAWLSEHFGSNAANASNVHQVDDLIVLVGAWYQHVSKLNADLPCGDDDQTVWGAYDVVATATIRSKLAKMLIELGAPHGGRVRTAIEEVDRMYLSFTEVDEPAILARLGGVDPGASEWWWRRVPSTGPARRELDELAW